MTDGGWEEFGRWHLLFDALCNRAGYYDDAELASAYCALTRSKGQRQFETALRNLNNWRSGRHLPRERNLRLLARLLDVADPALKRQWTHLYRQAREAEPVGADDPPQEGMAPSAGRPRRRFSAVQMAATGAAMLVVGIVLGSLATAADWRLWPGPADNAPIVSFRPVLKMKVGESRPIYAERGDCGKLPRAWPQVLSDLPEVGTGTFSDGGLARRHSKFCQGLTPARSIVFTASRAGVDEFEIQGDFFKLTVVE